VDRPLRLKNLDEALAELARLSQAPAIQPHTTWKWGQPLTHLAQSIENSMSGFPETKSALIQRTVGATAFGIFAWRGPMRHPLDDPIPGAPALVANTDAAAALTRLPTAVQAFRDHADTAAALCLRRTAQSRMRTGSRHATGQPLLCVHRLKVTQRLNPRTKVSKRNAHHRSIESRQTSPPQRLLRTRLNWRLRP
jgi:hypothetical protein